MIVCSAFTKVKAGCFLHAKMVAAVAHTHCCKDAPAVEDRGRSSEVCLGVDMNKSVRELPSMILKIASDVPPQGLGGGEDASMLNNVHAYDAVINDLPLSSSLQQNADRKKNEAEGPYADKMSLDGDSGVGVVPGNYEARTKEEMLKEIYALDDLWQEKELKKAGKTGPFDTSSAVCIRKINESGTRDVTTSDQIPLETNINSFHEEVHGDIHLHEASTQLENPSTVRKSKKRGRRQAVTSNEVISAQEMTEPSAGAVAVSKAIGEVLLHKDNQGLRGEGGESAYNVETIPDKTMVRQSDMHLSSSQLDNGSYGTKGVQLVNDALAAHGLIPDQTNIELVHKRSVPCEEKSTKEGNASWDGGEKHARKKQPIDGDGGHDKVVVGASNMETPSKSKNILEKIHTVGNTSQKKKHEKEKRVSSVDITLMDTAGEKDQCGYGEDATKLDTVPTQEGIVNDPSKQQVSSNVPQGDSVIMKNPSGDGKRRTKKRRRSESSKGSDPTQDVAKSSGLITNESSMQNTNAPPLGAKQTSPGTTEEATIGDHKKVDEILDKATTDVIDEVLADLRSTDRLNKDLDGDQLTEQTHLGSNQNVLRLENDGDKCGASAALPSENRAMVHSDIPISSSSPKKLKGKQPKVLSAALKTKSSSSGVVPEENDSTEIRESEKNIDLEDMVTENIVAQADNKTKGTKRQIKKVSLKHVPTDNDEANQYLGEQINHVAQEGLKGANTTKASLVHGAPVIETCATTVVKVQQKSKRSSKTKTTKIQETNHSTHAQDSHFAKDNHDEYTVDIGGIHDNQNAVEASIQSPVVQEDATTLKSSCRNARKGMKKSSKTELQNQGSDADLMNSRAERDGPKSSADAVDPNDHVVVHPGNENVIFPEHFRPDEMNGPSVSAENKENNVNETTKEVKDKRKIKRKPDIQYQHTGSIEPNNPLQFHLHTDETGLTDHCGTGNVDVLPVSAENMNIVDGDVKKVKERRKSKTKSNLVKPVSDQDHPYGDDADLMNPRTESGAVSPKTFADAVEANNHLVVHPGNDNIKFLEYFRPNEMNDASVSAQNKESNVDETIKEVREKKRIKRKTDSQSQRAGNVEPNDPLESHLHTEKTSLTDHSGTGNVDMPTVSAKNMNREGGNVKKAKERKKSKEKSNLVKHVSDQDHPSGDHEHTDNCTVQNGTMEQENGKENNEDVIQTNGILQQETVDATCDNTLENKLHRSKFSAGSQNNLPLDQDQGHMSTEQRKSTSQTKHHAKSKNHDGPFNERTGRNQAVRNLVKSFSMSPPASSESTGGTPQMANRYRVAVRKVPRKRYEPTSDRSKTDTNKRGTGAIFHDTISEGSDDESGSVIEKAAMEAPSGDSSTSADSGISSAAHDGSDVPDDDGVASLSQKSLKEGLHIGSVLRGCSSYRKAKKKQSELPEQLDDTEVPESQPAVGL